MRKEILQAVTLAGLGLFGTVSAGTGAMGLGLLARDRTERAIRSVAHQIAVGDGLRLPSREKSVADLIEEQARLQGLDPCLIKAVIKVESNNGKRLASNAGALGLMQVTRDTARLYTGMNMTDEEVLEPSTNLYLGSKVLSTNVEQYGLVTGLRVYHGGPDPKKWGEVNRAYPGKVLAERNKCRQS